MVRRTVVVAVLCTAVSVALSTLIATRMHKRTIKDVTDLMEGLQLYVKTHTRRE